MEGDVQYMVARQIYTLATYHDIFNQTESQILLHRHSRTAAKTATFPDGDYCYE